MADGSTINFRVFRFDPDENREPRYDTFPVTPRDGMTVLDGLLEVLENQDPSLAFRYCCRSAVCGSCAMYINGAYRLACETMIEKLKAREVSVSPLPHVPVIKDLVVDMEPFFEKYERILPYLRRETASPEKEIYQSPEQRKAIDEMVDCILCGACYSSCPVIWTHKDYLGPAALTKAYRFLADSRDEGARERLQIIDGQDGIWRCHTVFNCAEACPKKINPTFSIQQLKKRAMTRRLKFW